MVTRRFWLAKLEAAWKRRSVVWLSGVRRAGKTVLCRSLPTIEYFDCELPRARRAMEDPDAFLESMRGKRVVLDEIHRLANPSELLKIAADHFPKTRIVATGSSTLAATAKFRDALVDRKEDVWLTPMTSEDLRAFGNENLGHRLLRGGLPPFFLAQESSEREFQAWLDAYWAKDIQELFRLERRASFLRFVELMIARSGGVFEATAFAGPCEVSRPTITNYLGVLETTHVAHVVKPHSARKSTEIVAAPKVYAFDTGFVCTFRGWQSLRPEDLGLLWEHFVLNEMHAHLRTGEIRYWRDKRGHEVDFVLVRRAKPPTAIECKWKAKAFDASALVSFRRTHPNGENWVIAADVDRSYRRTEGDIAIEFISVAELVTRIA